MAARSKAWVCGRSPAGIAGSNPALVIDICLLLVLCVVSWRSLRRADHSSRGVLPSEVFLSVIVKPHNGEAMTHYRLLRHGKKYHYTKFSSYITENNAHLHYKNSRLMLYMKMN